MKKITVFILIMWLISFLICVGLVYLLADGKIFGSVVIIKYSWITYFLIIFPIIMIFTAIFSKNCKKKMNIILATIIIIYSLIFGSFRFIFSPMYSFDNHNIDSLNKIIKYDFDNDALMSITEIRNYEFTTSKIISIDKKNDFEKEIVNLNFVKVEDNLINNYVPNDLINKLGKYDYVLFYVSENAEYNTFPIEVGYYSFYYIFYNIEKGKLVYITDYNVLVS